MIDQVVELHFTSWHIGAIISKELIARKLSFYQEQKSTKTIEELKAELEKMKVEHVKVEKTISSLENHLSQARVDMCAAEGRVKEAEERANKAEDKLKVKQLAHVQKWTSFEELERAIRDLPEFADLVVNLAKSSFDKAIDEVRKIAPNVDLTSIYKANEAELDDEEEDNF